MMTVLYGLRVHRTLLLVIAAVIIAGCTLDMRAQPRYNPLAESDFFADHASARPRVTDTVARSTIYADQQLATGRVDGKLTASFPFTVTLAVLDRGHERYDIFCAPCHGLLGDGRGTIGAYGMKQPPSFHEQAMRDEPAGYYVETIIDGTRVMPSYAARIPPADRWAIVAYIRALQASQNANPAQVPAEKLPLLDQTDTITP
jgi:mono/diheme cytochrome c family protein